MIVIRIIYLFIHKKFRHFQPEPSKKIVTFPILKNLHVKYM